MKALPKAHDSHLDFCHPDFNPLLALTTFGVRPPLPDAIPLDNLHKCRSLLPEDHPSFFRVDKSVKSQPLSEARERERQNRVAYVQHKRERELANINVIDQITSRLQTGPFSVLYTLYRTKASIRVVTRHSRGIRGVSTGSLLAFDKHMNLVMKDVEEKYTVLVPFVNDKSRSVRRLEHRQRRLKLVFIYGSSIVMISKALDSHENSSKGLS